MWAKRSSAMRPPSLFGRYNHRLRVRYPSYQPAIWGVVTSETRTPVKRYRTLAGQRVYFAIRIFNESLVKPPTDTLVAPVRVYPNRATVRTRSIQQKLHAMIMHPQPGPSDHPPNSREFGARDNKRFPPVSFDEDNSNHKLTGKRCDGLIRSQRRECL
jgi:hypothetical protein